MGLNIAALALSILGEGIGELDDGARLGEAMARPEEICGIVGV